MSCHALCGARFLTRKPVQTIGRKRKGDEHITAILGKTSPCRRRQRIRATTQTTPTAIHERVSRRQLPVLPQTNSTGPWQKPLGLGWRRIVTTWSQTIAIPSCLEFDAIAGHIWTSHLPYTARCPPAQAYPHIMSRTST